MPRLLNPILTDSNLKIEHIFISKTFFSFKKFKRNLKFFISNKYPFCISFRDLILFSIEKTKIKFESLFYPNSKNNLQMFLKSKGSKYSYVDKVNDEKFLEKLRTLNPDIVLFANWTKTIKTI